MVAFSVSVSLTCIAATSHGEGVFGCSSLFEDEGASDGGDDKSVGEFAPVQIYQMVLMPLVRAELGGLEDGTSWLWAKGLRYCYALMHLFLLQRD